MSFPVESFWRLVVEAQLLSLDDCHRHHASWMQANPQGGDSNNLAEFLVATNVLSKYQASILLAGRAGPFVYGDYCIYDRIESGRLKGIFRAYHTATGHRVCLQFLTGEQANNPEVTAFLAQRAALVSRSSAGFPYLLRCYHLADHGAFKFFVLEDLQGKRIERILQQQGPMKAGEACRVTRQAALGLARLHAMQQAHGDVRPSNIWVDASGTVKMLQFPLSRDPLAPPIDWRAVLAQPDGPIPVEADYVAPETLTGSPPDARSDIYQLGCSLYQMLTNRPPFRGETLRDKLEGHLKGSPIPIEKINSEAPPELAKLVGYMMQKKPDMRFQQMSSVVEKLLPFMSQAEAESRPVPPTRAAVAYDSWLSDAMSGGAAAAVAQPGGFSQPAAAPQSPFGGAPAAAAGPARQPAAARGAAGPRVGGGSGSDLNERIRRRQKQSRRNMIAAVVVLLILGGLGFAFRDKIAAMFPKKEVADSNQKKDDAEKSAPTDPSASASSTAPASAPSPTGPVYEKRDMVASTNENGIFASPTSGPPLSLEHMVPGVEMIVALRPNQLFAGAESDDPANIDPTTLRPGVDILFDPKTLGPLGAWVTTTLPALAGTTNDKIDSVLVGFLNGPSADAAASACVIRLKEAIPEETLAAAWGGLEAETQGKLKVYKKDGLARYLPADGAGKIIVCAPIDKLADLEQYEGKAPNLASGVQWLLQTTDADRQFTVLYNPAFLELGGRSLVSPGVQKALPALEWLLTGGGPAATAGDMSAATAEKPTAVAFSVHLTKDRGWYYELRSYAASATSDNEGAAADLEQRVKDLPTRVKDYVFGANLSDYGKKIVLSLPDMVKFAARPSYVRVGSGDKHLVVNGYLPGDGGVSLVCGVYTALLESAKGAGGATAAVAVAQSTGVAPAAMPATAAEAIKKPMALQFDRNNLEVTMQLIAEEIGVPIEILGGDLQLEGITKNQSFPLDEKMQPADELLRKVLMKANPDGKLVYVFKPKNAGEPDMIFITTRAAVAKRKDPLPPEFAAAPGK